MIRTRRSTNQNDQTNTNNNNNNNNQTTTSNRALTYQELRQQLLPHVPHLHQSDRQLLIDCLRDVCISLAGFTLVHVVSDQIWYNVIGHDLYHWLSPSDRIYLGEKVCSSLHGALSGGGALYSIFIAKDYNRDIVITFPPIIRSVFCLSIGYELYDMATMYLQGSHPAQMWLHHTVVLIGASCSLAYRLGNFSPALFGVSEITVLFSNIRWYLRTFGLTNTPGSKLNDTLLLLAYVLFRVPLLPYFFYHAWKVKQLRAFYVSVPPIVPFLSTLFMFFLTFLNWNWTVALIRAYRRRHYT